MGKRATMVGPIIVHRVMLYPLARTLLFRLEAERSHRLALRALDLAERGGLVRVAAPRIAPGPRTVMGLAFPNPIGLAAGLDKDARHLDGLAALGFGFIEVGTVTPRPQGGNPAPRLFRLPAAGALINRMGFNNDGVDAAMRRIEAARYRGILGVNIGKNADTPAPDAAGDYLACLRRVYPLASYVAVNISSPNTAGLRALQLGGSLAALAQALKEAQDVLARRHGRYVPIAFKIAPDLTDPEIEAIAAALLEHGADGVIATNTTTARPGVQALPGAAEAGGLSGRPLAAVASRVQQSLVRHLAGRIPVIASGGIMDAGTAAARLRAGASLVQLYTGLVYRGPRLLREVAEAVA